MESRRLNSKLIAAVRGGKLEKVRNLINSLGLSHSQEWSQGYVSLCDALKNEHAAVAKLLLTSGSKVHSDSQKPTYTPLHFAVMNDNIEIVKMILDEGVNVDAKNQYGKTPLHVAADRGYLQIVEHLLDNGANVNHVYKWARGYTPLHFAVHKGNTEVITLFLSRGANVHVKGEDSITPLHIAAMNRYTRIAEDLLSYGACIHSSTLTRGYTPLHFASELDNEEIVQLFLDRGADVNAKTKDNSTPLHIATKRGREKVVKLLLQHGVKVDDQDKDGKTILQLAVEKKNLAIVEDVLKYCPDINNRSNRNSLEIAVYSYGEENGKIINALLEYGIIVDSENANDCKLLHAAVKNGYLKIVEELLKYGADINASDVCGRTTLHFTAEGFANIDVEVKIAKLLLSKGADVNAQTVNAEATFHAAVRRRHAKVVEALLEYNANVNCKDSDDNTPLHFSVRSGNKKLIMMLLNRGANVNAKQKDGSTALHSAALRGDKETVKVLLECGAKVDSKMENNTTPLHSAAEEGFREIIETLLEFGADINSRDKWDRTALYIASGKGLNKIVAILLEYGSDINITARNNHTPLDYAMAEIEAFSRQLENYGDNEDFYRAQRYFSRTRGAVAETLKRHIAKMKTANLYVSEQNLLLMSSSDGISNFEDKCEREIASMKSEEIDNANVSFYDMLAKDTSSLAKCMRNENIVQVLKLDSYKTKFPIYARMIENNFRKGMERKELLERGNGSLHILFNNLPKLLPECIEKIINYFSDEDLRNLIDASKPPGINDPNANDVVIP